MPESPNSPLPRQPFEDIEPEDPATSYTASWSHLNHRQRLGVCRNIGRYLTIAVVYLAGAGVFEAPICSLRGRLRRQYEIRRGLWQLWLLRN